MACFKVIAGEFSEDDDSRPRQCIPIHSPARHQQMIADLRWDYKLEVALGRSIEFDLGYLVAADLEKAFRRFVLDSADPASTRSQSHECSAPDNRF